MLNIGGLESATILSGCGGKGKPKRNRKLDKNDTGRENPAGLCLW
jgi:hypothetical protein